MSLFYEDFAVKKTSFKKSLESCVKYTLNGIHSKFGFLTPCMLTNKFLE